MRYRSVSWAAVVISLGLPVLAMARPKDEEHRDRRDTRDTRPDRRNEPERGEPKGVPTHEAPPAVAPAAARGTEQEWRSKIEEHLKQSQAAARANRKAIRKDDKAWNDGRVQRATNHRKDVAETLGNVTESPEVRAELSTHADRMARLNRAMDVAEDKGDSALVNRVNDMINRENARDASVIAAIKARAGVP